MRHRSAERATDRAENVPKTERYEAHLRPGRGRPTDTPERLRPRRVADLRPPTHMRILAAARLM